MERIQEEQYRVKRYLYKSFVIERRHKYTTGKHAGKWSHWYEYKYPGSLLEAAKGLLMEAFPLNTPHYELATLEASLADALKKVEGWLYEKISDTDLEEQTAKGDEN